MSKYTHDTPEWQLYQNFKASSLLVETYTTDAHRYLEKAESARMKAKSYEIALRKLDPEFSDDA